MAVAVGQLLAAIEHEIGGPVASEIGGGLALVNKAGRHMYSMHGWVSALRASGTLSYVAGQAWLDLPADIGTIEGLEEGTLPFTLVSFPELIQYRAVGSGERIGALVMSGGVYRIELAVTPAAASANAITIAYSRQWVDVDADADEIDVPRWLEALLDRVVRAFARGHESGTVDEELVKVEMSPILNAAKLQDAAIVRILPRVYGTGAVERPTFWDPHRYIRDTVVT